MLRLKYRAAKLGLLKDHKDALTKKMTADAYQIVIKKQEDSNKVQAIEQEGNIKKRAFWTSRGHIPE